VSGNPLETLAATPEQVPLTEAQATELDRRLATYEADPQAGSTWDEVKTRLWGQP
jgi:putative addiction module component (TIGR02574 family)